MNARSFAGLFIAEGSSDLPLADLVEALFVDRGVTLRLSKPDFSLLGKIPKDVRSRVTAGMKLLRDPVDLVVVHRDSDNVGHEIRRTEIEKAVREAGVVSSVVPVIPVRMTEAWLLLDEDGIRQVAGNPRGRHDLRLPRVHEVEGVADPKQMLQQCLITAADVVGRRHDRVTKRFFQHRRQLLERLDCAGPVSRLPSWKRLVADVDAVVEQWK
ncbi:DUF4276 family protein [Streptosporangium sp. NBC_01755]|uniref:hypothetical protein n=1 Tax=unclassified Streptosporangium TaxID=2632669 RepID=UPI002DDB43EB|nr:MULTISPECIES: hypothetical protein [unclassified Streptosporangium]WSA28085.1 DUF4276 family protein [Streptosporangium sp. NBC_01810]WSD00442.1 DUF4276 family protein [Streptosporangium sp. NBC_01755]